jgi:hypothetical protein
VSACVQWELKKFLKTWFPRVGVIGGLVVFKKMLSCLAGLGACGWEGCGFQDSRILGFQDSGRIRRIH